VWIANFLGQRQQVVVVDGTTSNPVWVKSGVLQGSVIGPLLFLILISEINKDVKHSSLSLFADNTRVWKHVSSEQDSKSLQQDLEAVYSWAKENNMEFNSDKFEWISFGGGKIQQNYLSPSKEPIVYRDSLRDLGVIMSNDCTFGPHIQSVITKASRMAGWVLRTFKTRERQVMLTLYKQLVLSQLEYCCPVWALTNVASIMAIEAVQRAYTRRIHGMSGKEPQLLDATERTKIIQPWKKEGAIHNFVHVENY
jgi:ribonuclease P/MRP protein subunit RPP40